MTKSYFYIILFTFLLACQQNNKRGETARRLETTDSINKFKKDSNKIIKPNNSMNERYDYESTDSGKKSVYIEKNGWVIRKGMMHTTGADYDMYPPTPEFYEIGKVFYFNGNIKSEITSLGSFVFINTSRYYDEDGYLVKEVNENKKFGSIKPAYILKFLEREGWIDLKTGKGRAHIVVKDNELIESEDCVFELNFELIGESYFIKDNKVPIWVVTIPAAPKTQYYETRYLINGETGELIKKERKLEVKNI